MVKDMSLSTRARIEDLETPQNFFGHGEDLKFIKLCVDGAADFVTREYDSSSTYTVSVDNKVRKSTSNEPTAKPNLSSSAKPNQHTRRADSLYESIFYVVFANTRLDKAQHGGR